MKLLPWLMVLGRLALAPVLVLAQARDLLSERGVLAIYLAAFASDYLDGAIARRLGVATARLRAADSAVDTVFHVALGWVTWCRHETELRAHATALAVFFATFVSWTLLDAVRWQRVAGFHALSAKLFSVALGVWLVALYGGAETGALLTLALAVGTFANVEGIAISLALESPQTDVPTLLHALRRRRPKTAS